LTPRYKQIHKVEHNSLTPEVIFKKTSNTA
jgi:hypothetical protein